MMKDTKNLKKYLISSIQMSIIIIVDQPRTTIHGGSS